jgi:hypothetical protein
MFRRYLLTPCLAPPDGVGGGGAAATADSGGAPAGGGAAEPTDDGGDLDDGGADDGPLDAGADGDPDADEDLRELEEDLAQLPPEAQQKRIRTRYRRASRQLRTVRPIAEMFRDPSGRFLPADEVQRIVHDARDMREVNAFLTEHPDLMQQMLERRRGGGGRKPEAPTAFQDPFADEAALPLDMTNEASRFVVQHLRDARRENFELRQMLEDIRRGVGGMQQTEAERRLADTETTWRTSTLEAAQRAGLDERSRQLFVNAVWKSFELAKARNILGRVDLKQVITRELKPYAGQRRRQVADTQTRAQHATTVPRPAGRGQTAAASAQDTNKSAGTLKDARKSFFERIGMRTPPR